MCDICNFPEPVKDVPKSNEVVDTLIEIRDLLSEINESLEHIHNAIYNVKGK